ncbi:MAG: heavy-metal-associated domain-containing protein [Chloroflexi bacterium]|nr:heavy-metal-associated domain-containing protein [Chloroflexota bacterium]
MNDVPTTSALRRGFLAGVIGSLCCLGPTAALLLGLGSSSALFSLQFDQSWALGFSLVVLAGGMLQALRRSRSGAVCRVARWRSPLMMALSFAISYALLGVLLPLFAARQELAAEVVANRETAHVASIAANVGGQTQPIAAPAENKAPELRRLTMIIEKMNCPPCAAKVHNRLSQKPAVRELRAEAYNEEVVVTYDASLSSGEQLMKLFPRQYGLFLISDVPVQ